jgi:hypothetical protein
MPDFDVWLYDLYCEAADKGVKLEFVRLNAQWLKTQYNLKVDARHAAFILSIL